MKRNLALISDFKAEHDQGDLCEVAAHYAVLSGMTQCGSVICRPQSIYAICVVSGDLTAVTDLPVTVAPNVSVPCNFHTHPCGDPVGPVRVSVFSALVQAFVLYQFIESLCL